jgi:hypothetical protein
LNIEVNHLRQLIIATGYRVVMGIDFVADLEFERG